MTIRNTLAATIAILLTASSMWASAAEPFAPESKRLVRARDYIADEKWGLAIADLRVAVDDPKETRRDEALYWLAHSQYHSGDPGSAIVTINRLERDFPKSMWVKNGQSLRIEIAVRLERRDVLWWTALAPQPPPMPKAIPRPKRAPRVVVDPQAEAIVASESVPKPPAPAESGPKPPKALSAPKMPPPPPAIWISDNVSTNADVKILALRGLMRYSDDVDQVVHILGEIALEGEPGPATQAVFALAQSPSVKARETVVRVAKSASEPVRVAAVRDLGRFGGPEISGELLAVYMDATLPVKMQIVNTFGERAEQTPLVKIVQAEKDGAVRFGAMAKLAQVGGFVRVAGIYKSASPEGKRSIIRGLFVARADVALIQIADEERASGNEELCGDALERLRMLDTPKAKAYLQNVSKKR
jgi:hypothetical protein